MEDQNGRHTVKLGQGAKGLIALVEIDRNLKRHRWIWNDTQYIGSYDTKEIKTKKRIVELDEINDKYSDMGISKAFNPRTYTGLRKLKTKAEIVALSRLMGVQ